MREQCPRAEIVEDISSGLNFTRQGLPSLLIKLMRGDKLTIVVACRDRLLPMADTTWSLRKKCHPHSPIKDGWLPWRWWDILSTYVFMGQTLTLLAFVSEKVSDGCKQFLFCPNYNA